jgi:glycosyltransferase involved in cell wall biosynthesis
MDRLGLQKPLVSLAMPVYNGEAFLADAIQSCLAQDYDNFELIITDNSSTDGTETICRGFAVSDSRVRYIRNERNLGAGPNFNRGFELSSGKYLKWCAADDRISPNFVSACIAVLEQNPDVVLAYGETKSIDSSGQIIPLVGRGMTEQEDTDGLARRFYKDLYDRATNFEIFGLFRKSALARTMLHRPYYGSDVTLVTEMVLLGHFRYVPDAIFYNREHPARSINMRDKKALLAWQDSSTRSKPRPRNFYVLKHMVEIAFRHRKTTPFLKILGVIFIWSLDKLNDRLKLRFQRLSRLLLSRVRL